MKKERKPWEEEEIGKLEVSEKRFMNRARVILL